MVQACGNGGKHIILPTLSFSPMHEQCSSNLKELSLKTFALEIFCYIIVPRDTIIWT